MPKRKFWSKFDQEKFHMEIKKFLIEELSQGFTELVSYLKENARELGLKKDALVRSETILWKLNDKLKQTTTENLEVFKDMCKTGVFEEPHEINLEMEVPSVADEEELDKSIDQLLIKTAILKAELQSLQERNFQLNAISANLENNLSKVKEVAELVDLKKLSNVSQDCKRLRHLVDCSNNLKAKFPENRKKPIEITIIEERRGMPSNRELKKLDEALSNCQ